MEADPSSPGSKKRVEGRLMLGRGDAVLAEAKANGKVAAVFAVALAVARMASTRGGAPFGASPSKVRAARCLPPTHHTRPHLLKPHRS